MPTRPATQPPDTAASATTAQVATEAAVVAVFVALNANLLADFAKVLKSHPIPATADDPILLSRLQHLGRANVVKAATELGPLVGEMFRAAYTEGIKDAASAFHAGRGDGRHGGASAWGILNDHWRTHAERSVEVIRAALVDDIRVVNMQVLRAPLDVYKRITAATARAQIAENGLSPRVARAQAWSQYVQQGITGYTDRTGREWNLTTYTEMAVRTSAIRAYNISYQDQLAALGVHLYTVPGDGHPCPLCLPWQGAILSDGDAPLAGAEATVDDARAAGLFHPQCKHVLLPFFPGVSVTPERASWTDEHQAAYAATQRLRALERRLRAQKAAADLAIDPTVRHDLMRRVRATQALVREHVQQHDLVRRTHREQPHP